MTRRLGQGLAVLVALLALRGAVRAWEEAAATPALRAADALPVYLAGAAVIDGEDPTTQNGLRRAYEHRDMGVRAATFSNLYPASTGVLVQPLAAGTWEAFVPRWRALLLLGALLAGAGGGLAAARGPARPLAAAVGAWLALSAFPVTGECMALGQANLLVAGLMGVAMAALALGAGRVAGVAAVLGAGLKLVPGVVLWALLAGRRWRALLVAAGAGLAILAVTVAHVPLDRVVSGVRATLRFQATITPDWMNHGPTPRWLLVLGDFRHTPLMLLTVLLMGAAAWLGPTRRALPGAVALAAAWLGADSAAFHVLYAPLFIPALAWVALWPLDEDAPAWSWLLAPLAAAPAVLAAWDLAQVGPEARLVLAGLLVWGGAALRLAWLSPALPWPVVALAGLVVGWGGARAERFDQAPRGPDPAQVADVTGYGLPEGVGHGGPQPGTGPTDLVGQPDESGSTLLLEEVLPADVAMRLTSHLVQAPAKWRQVDHPLARRLERTAPVPPAALVPYRDMAAWLAWERHALDRVPEARAARDEFERTWRVLTAE